MAVITDLIEDYEAVEEEGHVVSVTRKFIGTGAASSTLAALTNEAFTSSSFPSRGDTLPGNTNLVCTGRRVRLLTNSNRSIEITCQYLPLGQSKSTFIFSGSTTLSQDATQLDRYGNQIYVSHTFPNDDPDEDYAGETKNQGIDLTVFMPQTTLTATGQLQVAYPDYVSRYWVGAMNGTFWAGADPYYWMCTRVDFSPLDVGFGRFRYWEFTFEFQHRQTGWIPQIFYIDPRTGKPPINIVPNVGAKYIDWYSAIDYNYLFPVR